MIKVEQALDALFEAAPKELALDYDNVGLMIGGKERNVSKILIALDVTEKVFYNAAQKGCELIVAHHPIIWDPLRSITDDTPQGRLIARIIKSGISVIAMHTNADAAAGGVNDRLAGILELMGVTLIEDENLIGRMGKLKSPMSPEQFKAYVEKRIMPTGIRAHLAGRQIRSVAVAGGGCGGYIGKAAAAGADAFVTGDIKHDQFMLAASLGITVIDAGHYETESCACGFFKDILCEKFPQIEIIVDDSPRELFN